MVRALLGKLCAAGCGSLLRRRAWELPRGTSEARQRITQNQKTL